MHIEKEAVRQVVTRPLVVGESPVWDAASGCLYFVDIQAPALFRLDPVSGSLEHWPMPSPIGSFGLCADGRVIVALKDGVYFFDFSTSKFEFIVAPEPDRPGNRLNDGKVGPDGRFWVGSMDDTPDKKPVAALYRIDRDGSCECMADGLIVSNGLSWSTDGSIMYHSDSRQATLWAYDYDLESGSISNRRVVRRMTDEEGRPDGAAVDQEGFYWSAGVSAGCLNRIASDGTIVRKLMMPCPAPTMPCFGGPDLKTLFVTSLTKESDGSKVPGSVYSLEVDVAGTPIARFGVPLLPV